MFFRHGLALTGVGKVKFVIAIAGGKIQAPVAAAKAFDSKIMCPSLHFVGKFFILLTSSVHRTLSVEDRGSADSWLPLHKLCGSLQCVGQFFL